ncbi:hypothetical protein EVAR_49825_1 [Eumeta japonica]|uniref:Uncharacterized protein n=1 Tax=Eumeta variegata TaxID=151549 RepID=A0A4C1XM97_EUMVA|nr:hypothetical protein EVAR_49825_1 [Eumeta japonica]
MTKVSKKVRSVPLAVIYSADAQNYLVMQFSFRWRGPLWTPSPVISEMKFVYEYLQLSKRHGLIFIIYDQITNGREARGRLRLEYNVRKFAVVKFAMIASQPRKIESQRRRRNGQGENTCAIYHSQPIQSGKVSGGVSITDDPSRTPTVYQIEYKLKKRTLNGSLMTRWPGERRCVRALNSAGLSLWLQGVQCTIASSSRAPNATRDTSDEHESPAAPALCPCALIIAHAGRGSKASGQSSSKITSGILSRRRLPALALLQAISIRFRLDFDSARKLPHPVTFYIHPRNVFIIGQRPDDYRRRIRAVLASERTARTESELVRFPAAVHDGGGHETLPF